MGVGSLFPWSGAPQKRQNCDAGSHAPRQRVHTRVSSRARTGVTGTTRPGAIAAKACAGFGGGGTRFAGGGGAMFAAGERAGGPCGESPGAGDVPANAFPHVTQKRIVASFQAPHRLHAVRIGGGVGVAARGVNSNTGAAGRTAPPPRCDAGGPSL